MIYYARGIMLRMFSFNGSMINEGEIILFPSVKNEIIDCTTFWPLAGWHTPWYVGVILNDTISIEVANTIIKDQFQSWSKLIDGRTGCSILSEKQLSDFLQEIQK
jgi:hypothetical protein